MADEVRPLHVRRVSQAHLRAAMVVEVAPAPPASEGERMTAEQARLQLLKDQHRLAQARRQLAREQELGIYSPDTAALVSLAQRVVIQSQERVRRSTREGVELTADA
jgi:hypothetical protein